MRNNLFGPVGTKNRRESAKSLLLRASFFSFLVCSAPLAQAHHSFVAQFDLKKPVTLRGTVAAFEFVNPHGWIALDVKESNGLITRWMIETAEINILIRNGWRKDSLKPGDPCTVNAFAAKDGSRTAGARQALLHDGRWVFAGAPNNSGY